MAAEATLLFGKSLFFLTLGATTVHFSIAQIVFKKQATAGAFARSRLNCSATAGDWTFKDGFAVTTPIFSLERFLTFLTSFNGHHSLQYRTDFEPTVTCYRFTS